MGSENIIFLQKLKSKTVVVMGMGKTGIALSNFLIGKCKELIVTDSHNVNSLDSYISSNVRTEFGGHKKETFQKCDLLIVSPGVPEDNFFVQIAFASGVEVVSEIEFAWRLSNIPLVSITGTNGKTTTLTMLSEILANSDFRISVGGNIGRPLIDVVQNETNDLDFILCEVSSFQLELSSSLRPYLAMITNVTEDHIGRHKSIEDYLSVKTKLLCNQKKNDVKIINSDDPITKHLEFEGEQETLTFSRKGEVEKGSFVKNDKIYIISDDTIQEVCDISEIYLPGLHNLENLLGACAAGSFLGADIVSMKRTAINFKGLPHRMEVISKKNDITWINDSKATNVGSTKMSLLSLRGNVILIAGGFDKNSNLEYILPAVKSKVIKIFLIGDSAKRFYEFFQSEVETEIIFNLEDAVSIISKRAISGQTVLFSPACSSFDQFDDYIQRGNAFRELVNERYEN